MSRDFRRLALAALLLLLARTPAQAQWVEIEEWIAYDSSTAAYDSQEDIVGVLVDDFAYEEEFWLYFQCGANLSWFEEPAPGRWDALEPEYQPIRENLCARRGALPFRDF
jgi:hypothetical protein